MQGKKAISRWNNRPVTKSRTIVSEGGASGKVATFSSENNSRATSVVEPLDGVEGNSGNAARSLKSFPWVTAVA